MQNNDEESMIFLNVFYSPTEYKGCMLSFEYKQYMISSSSYNFWWRVQEWMHGYTIKWPLNEMRIPFEKVKWRRSWIRAHVLLNDSIHKVRRCEKTELRGWINEGKHTETEGERKGERERHRECEREGVAGKEKMIHGTK